jgi:hypothetical protein
MNTIKLSKIVGHIPNHKTAGVNVIKLFFFIADEEAK